MDRMDMLAELAESHDVVIEHDHRGFVVRTRSKQYAERGWSATRPAATLKEAIGDSWGGASWPTDAPSTYCRPADRWNLED